MKMISSSRYLHVNVGDYIVILYRESLNIFYSVFLRLFV